MAETETKLAEQDEHESDGEEDDSSSEEESSSFVLSEMLDSALNTVCSAAEPRDTTKEDPMEKKKDDVIHADDSSLLESALKESEEAEGSSSSDTRRKKSAKTETEDALKELFDQCMEQATERTVDIDNEETIVSGSGTSSTDGWKSMIDAGLAAMNDSIESAKRRKGGASASSSSSSSSIAGSSSSSSAINSGLSDDPLSKLLSAMEGPSSASTHGINAAADESGAPTEVDAQMAQLFESLMGGLTQSGDDQTDDAKFEQTMKDILGSLFDRESLKEPVLKIAERFPRWLDENRDRLSESDLQKYQKQCDLYLKARDLLEDDCSDTSELMDTVTQTFQLGTLPESVMDGMMPEELRSLVSQIGEMEKALDSEESTHPESAAEDGGGTLPAGIEDTEVEKLMREMQASFESMAGEGGSLPEGLPGMPPLTEEQRAEFEKLMASNDCSVM